MSFSADTASIGKQRAIEKYWSGLHGYKSLHFLIKPQHFNICCCHPALGGSWGGDGKGYPGCRAVEHEPGNVARGAAENAEECNRQLGFSPLHLRLYLISQERLPLADRLASRLDRIPARIVWPGRKAAWDIALHDETLQDSRQSGIPE